MNLVANYLIGRKNFIIHLTPTRRMGGSAEANAPVKMICDVRRHEILLAIEIHLNFIQIRKSRRTYARRPSHRDQILIFDSKSAENNLSASCHYRNI